MSDERVRALERSAARGDRADAIALHRERVRRGLLVVGERRRIDLPGSPEELQLLPDGRALVLACEPGVYELGIWDLASGERVAAAGEVPALHPSVSRDGRRVAFGVTTHNPTVYSYAGHLLVRELESGREVWRTETPTGVAWRCAWSPGDDRLVATCTDKTLRVFEGASGRLLNEWRVPAARGERAVAWLPDDERVVSGSTDKAVRVWEAATGRELACLRGHAKQVECVAVSPAGELAVTGSTDATVCVWDLARARLLARLEGHAKSVDCVALSPISRRAVSGSKDGTLRVWDLPSGRELARFEHLPRPAGFLWVQALACTADGAAVVSVTTDRTLDVWTLPP